MGNIMVNKVSKVGPDLDFFFFLNCKCLYPVFICGVGLQ